MNPTLTPEQLTRIDDLLLEGNKISAIKLYRSFAGCELVVAKRFIEGRLTELQQSDPSRFAPRSAGCLGLVVMLAAVTAIVAIGSAWAGE